VLVVGAGPAGADLTRQLAAYGEDVVLAERLPDLRRAAFSSAALPLDALDRFGLPSSVVAHRWSGWELLGPGEARRSWQGGRPQGVVLDFVALREWLVGEAQRWGARVWLGHRALACHQEADGLHTVLRRGDGSQLEVHSDWVIDATGQERSLLGDPPAGGPGAETLVSGVGLEWLVQVPSSCWERWSDRLAFCLGSDWVAQGYGWVFPMQAPLLKLGVCRLLDPSRHQPPLGGVLERLIERLLAPAERQAMAVVDRHGGLIRSSIRRREPHRRGRLVGLGDAVSTANLLGGEGIRHALMSSRVLAPLLLEELRHRPEVCCVDRYPLELRRALGWRWSLSGRLARRTWLGLHGSAADRRLGSLLTSLEQEEASALTDLLFGYRFERYGMRALPYLLGLR
jgi:flavin-dependent dehydrogenase